MRKGLLCGLFLLTTTVAFAIPVTAQKTDGFLGTWKLNVAKSKYEPAANAPKSALVKQVAVAGGGMKSTADGVDAQGKPTHTEVTTMFDGKSSAVKGATDANTTRVYKKIDDRTYEFVTSVNGKVTTTSRSVNSADGKTRTTTTTGKNAQGVTIKNVAVYEKQ